jgi:hypothetical protein
MSSALSFSFRPSLIPAQYQAEFISRFCQLALEYETLTAPVPEAPSADAVPQPSSFAPVHGDGADGEVPPPADADEPKKARKNPWAGLTDEQRAERLAAMRRGRATKAAQRRVSADSLEASAAPVVVAAADDAASDTSSKDKKAEDMMRDRLSLSSLTKEQMAERVAMMRKARRAAKKAAAPAPAPAEDGAASEISSVKKSRKNPWVTLTEEQRTARLVAMKAGRDAKKAAAAASTGTLVASLPSV